MAGPRLVVIGGVAAGMAAAARVRRLSPSMEVVVCEKGAHVAYGACGLPYLLEGRVNDFRQLVVRGESAWRNAGVQVRTGAEVAAIQHGRRLVRLCSGEELHYDKLLIATGARPLLPAHRAGGYALHCLSEALQLRERLDAAGHRPGEALIAGGSFLALEAVEALRARGWRVSLAHAGRHLLRREDPWLTARLEAHLARCGVAVHHGRRIEAAQPDTLTVFATGIEPNTTLARDAGVRLGRTGAIETDARMETSVSGIFAAGDCAETTHLVTGRPIWLPLGTTANKMGRVAAASITGVRRERFPGVVGTAIARVCGLGVGVTGLSAAQARAEGFDPVEAVIDAPLDRARYFRGRPTAVQLVADRRDGRLLGGAVIGEAGVEGRIGTMATALTARLTAEQFSLLDLAYAPPFAPLWDPVLIAAQQLLHQL